MKRIMILIALVILSGCCGKKGFTLWQLPSQVNTIGNSYVILTENDKVIVMDGGMPQETDYFRGFIDALGGEIDAWFISHPHDDHMSVLVEVLKNSKGLKINHIYHSRFTEELIMSESPATAELTRNFYSLLDNCGIAVTDCHCGDLFEIDGVNIKVLSEKNPEMAHLDYNNSSMALKVWDSSKSIIFLGDLGPQGGQKLLNSEYADELVCDYLQMSHHGQNGCDKEFYEKTSFRACLWPTPSWVYDNNLGNGFNTGHLKTIEVRDWMKEKGITEHYVSCEGLAVIR